MKNRRSIHIFKNPVMQTWPDLFFINELLTDIKFDTIVELGTYRGGLTVFFGLHALSNPPCKVITFDIRPEPDKFPFTMYKKLCPITYYNLDVFSEEAKNIVRTAAKSGRILLFCDGGIKPQDFQTYAPLLEGTDIVLIHDKGRGVYQHEVDPVAERNGLTPFYQEEADKVGADIFSFTKTYHRRDPS